jgi:hypothetical protein
LYAGRSKEGDEKGIRVGAAERTLVAVSSALCLIISGGYVTPTRKECESGYLTLNGRWELGSLETTAEGYHSF